MTWLAATPHAHLPGYLSAKMDLLAAAARVAQQLSELTFDRGKHGSPGHPPSSWTSPGPLARANGSTAGSGTRIQRWRS